MGVYKVQGITKEKFVGNVVEIEMQCHHLYNAYHVAKATNATAIYQTKHGIVNNDMV